MSSIIFFLIFIPVLSLILLNLNFFLAPHRPYKEKKTPFECGYHSFITQNRTQFTISFFIFALLFLLFDIEISTIFPVVVSSHLIEAFGIYAVIVFVFILTFGFVFELGKNALKIDTKQDMFYLESKFSFIDKIYKLISILPYIVVSVITVNLFFKLPATLLFNYFEYSYIYVTPFITTFSVLMIRNIFLGFKGLYTSKGQTLAIAYFTFITSSYIGMIVTQCKIVDENIFTSSMLVISQQALAVQLFFSDFSFESYFAAHVRKRYGVICDSTLAYAGSGGNDTRGPKLGNPAKAKTDTSVLLANGANSADNTSGDNASGASGGASANPNRLPAIREQRSPTPNIERTPALDTQPDLPAFDAHKIHHDQYGKLEKGQVRRDQIPPRVPKSDLVITGGTIRIADNPISETVQVYFWNGLIHRNFNGARSHSLDGLTPNKHITDMNANDPNGQLARGFKEGGLNQPLAGNFGAMFYELTRGGNRNISISPDSFDTLSRAKYEYLKNAGKGIPNRYERVVVTQEFIKNLFKRP